MSPGSIYRAIAVFACCLAAAARAAAAPAIPDTPPGRTLTAWLDAFNSGDRDRLAAFQRDFSWDADVDGTLGWHDEVGGYELLAVYTNDATRILFRLKANANGGEEIGTIRLNPVNARQLQELGTFRVPAGSRFEPVTFDAKTRARVVAAVGDTLEKSYVFPEVAQRMSAALRRRLSSADYRAVRDGRDMATLLTRDLRDVSHDPHLEIRFSYVVLPATLGRGPLDDPAWMASMNCGFAKVEHLRSNIGYVKFDGFMDARVCGATASAAMNFIADSDALIFDLRDNHGGGGGMPEYLAAYLFADRTHLDDLYSRTTNTTTETWTVADVPGRKFIGKPVYVLTSHGTFSAAEYFANVLRNLRGATLVGETTGGGAHLTDMMRVDDHFSARVPTGRPLTKTDWDGKGLEPDVKVPPDDALDAAVKLATHR